MYEGDYRPGRKSAYWTDEHAMRMYSDPAYRLRNVTGLGRDELQAMADTGGVAYVGSGMRPVEVYETALEAPDTALGGLTQGEYYGVRPRRFNQFEALLRR